MGFIRQNSKALQRRVGDWVDRGLDRHVRLAVTGLSRSGKTAFITALVNQLEHACDDARLPLWDVARSGRLLGVRRVGQLNAHIPSFAYERGLERLFGEPPAWPEPTRGVAEIRLEIRYRPTGALRRRLSETATLYLDIVDYPGEWLLDLPLLELNYGQWSASVLAALRDPVVRELAAPWLALSLSAEQAFDERVVAQLAQAYTAFLHACKDRLGLSLIQPGRFVLPGEYVGAPMLQFVPWAWHEPVAEPAEGSMYATLAHRYEQYKRHLVRGFYKEHFSGFDRQIVLVDCLQALNAGSGGFEDMRRAIGRIMQSFSYGKSSWWRRLFVPRIDRLLFVASKADHVTPDQHYNMVSLLQHIVQSARGQARFEGVTTDCLAIAAVRATEAGTGRHGGVELPGIRGNGLDGEALFVAPGRVPPEPPDDAWWRQREAAFDAFRPLRMVRGHAMPHIRLDAALEFLLGDKMA
jgi:predicted YcjX-like family ATPase